MNDFYKCCGCVGQHGPHCSGAGKEHEEALYRRMEMAQERLREEEMHEEEPSEQKATP